MNNFIVLFSILCIVPNPSPIFRIFPKRPPATIIFSKFWFFLMHCNNNTFYNANCAKAFGLANRQLFWA